MPRQQTLPALANRSMHCSCMQMYVYFANCAGLACAMRGCPCRAPALETIRGTIRKHAMHLQCTSCRSSFSNGLPVSANLMPIARQLVVAVFVAVAVRLTWPVLQALRDYVYTNQHLLRFRITIKSILAPVQVLCDTISPFVIPFVRSAGRVGRCTPLVFLLAPSVQPAAAARCCDLGCHLHGGPSRPARRRGHARCARRSLRRQSTEGRCLAEAEP